jgi:hypothetical protein
MFLILRVVFSSDPVSLDIEIFIERLLVPFLIINYF